MKSKLIAYQIIRAKLNTHETPSEDFRVKDERMKQLSKFNVNYCRLFMKDFQNQQIGICNILKKKTRLSMDKPWRRVQITVMPTSHSRRTNARRHRA